MENLKVCKCCNTEKATKEFYKRADSAKTLYRSHCKSCCNKKSREHSKTNRYKVYKKATQRRHKDRGLTMLWMAKNRSHKKGLDFNIDETDVLIPSHCPVLGIPLKPQVGKATHNSPSLDRIDSKKGYVKGNVIVVSRRANLLKNDATLEEMEKIYKFYKNFDVQYELKEGRLR